MLRRLFPPAYVDDEEKEAGFRALARDELLEARLAALDELEAALADPVMDAERAGSPACAAATPCGWCSAPGSTSARTTTRRSTPTTPTSPAWALYYFLSGLVGELVEALAADL